MPPKKATAAQKGKAKVAETSRAPRVTVTRARAQTMPGITLQSEGSITPPAEPGAGPSAAPATPAPAAPAPQSGADDRTLTEVVQLQTTLVAGQAQRHGRRDDDDGRRDSLRVREFLLCGPPEFSGSKPDEDPHDFIRGMRRSVDLVRASETESVELASHRLRDVAAHWYESWELARGRGASPATWDEFEAAFLSHFLPPELRRARVDRFLQIRQRGRSVREYNLEFDSLARYAPAIVAEMADRMHRYVIGLDRYLVESCMSMASRTDMDIARLQAYAQGMEDRYRADQSTRDRDRRPPKRARFAGYSGDSRGGQPQQRQSGRQLPPPGQSTQSGGRRFDSAGPSGAGQGSRAAGPQVSRGPSQPRPPRPRCSHCGKSHPGECYRATGACFTCGGQGHFMRDCPLASGSGSVAQPTGSAAGSSSAPSVARPAGRGVPTSAGRGRGRGGVAGSSGPSNRIYALASRQDQEASPNVVTGTDIGDPPL
ncbi:uncharacterized protein LOC132622483 [Lycium barbarum]|uniref:uncharacterized protein LOC132622483 n=1 Tax=Lycium barbarum TaxID=112863 RepID=UPI00293EBF8E|nr:uncharacterized protein LOC132622483 [Lycium barbarum]